MGGRTRHGARHPDERTRPCVTRVSIRDGLDWRSHGALNMKMAAVVGTSVLGLLLGTTTPANAQHGGEDGRHAGSEDQQRNGHQKEHGRPSKQHSDKHQGNEPAQGREQHHDEQQRANHNRPERQQPHHQQANEPEHMREAGGHKHEPHGRQRDVWQDHRARNWQSEHRGWRERGGYSGHHIPEDSFRAYFGRGRWFCVRNAPTIVVDGYPRFQYRGFWFSLVDPWPEYWSRTWYETDDVYVDYVTDGYYMYNRRHPGIAVAVNVSF